MGSWTPSNSTGPRDLRHSPLRLRYDPTSVQDSIVVSCSPPGRSVHVFRLVPTKEPTMSKRARKRRSRKGKAANHGHKPNA